MHELAIVLIFLLSTYSTNIALGFSRPVNFYKKNLLTKTNFQLKAFTGIAEKFGGVVDLLLGQTQITEKNIEDTLKVFSPCPYRKTK